MLEILGSNVYHQLLLQNNIYNKNLNKIKLIFPDVPFINN